MPYISILRTIGSGDRAACGNNFRRSGWFMDNPKVMSYAGHFGELRRRLLLSAAGVLVAFVGVYLIYADSVVALLSSPGGVDVALVALAPQEPFLVKIKVALIAAIVLASPLIIYHAWAFIWPGLSTRERRVIIPALTAGTALFALGTVVCYLIVLPLVYKFFLQLSAQAGVQVAWSLASVIHLNTTLLLAFGVSFELPLVLACLSWLALITPQMLARSRALAIMLIAIGSAMITPPDLMSMLLLMLPLYLLYEFGILLARIFAKPPEALA